MFGTIGRLKGLLTKENLRFLDVILAALVDGNSPTYAPFWTFFKGKFPGNPAAPDMAWRALRELRSILKEYQGEQ